jgi:hypothetical protein
VFIAASLVHCSSSSDDAAPGTTPGADGGPGSDAATTADTSTTADTGGGDATNDAATAGPPITVTAFDASTTFGANYLTCDPSGNCYGNRTNIYKLPANGTMYSLIGNSANGLITATPSSILLDNAGNLYTNACGGTPGVYKLPSGTTTWTNFGTGLTGANPTSCNFNTMASDSAGTLYVGFAVDKALWKLPVGQTAWTATPTDLNQVVRATATRGNDVYIAYSGGVKKLASGAATWTDYGSTSNGASLPLHMSFDPSGNLYVTNETTVYKLAVGATDWVATTNLATGSIASNPVFDSAGTGFIAARDNGGNVYSLLKLTAGTTAWAKVVDTTVFLSENCYALADDHIGHLVLQCNTTMLRSH